MSNTASPNQNNSNYTPFEFDNTITFEDVRKDHQQFTDERNWRKYHTPRNLLMALNGEIGELNELFQWRGDENCPVGLENWTKEEKEHLGEELSDCIIYLCALASKCNVDLPKACLEKMQKNRKKYSVDKVLQASNSQVESAAERNKYFTKESSE